jgi:putative colanic acid biosynthesis acetyltransferase WcaB
MVSELRADIKRNKGNYKGLFLSVFFRLANKSADLRKVSILHSLLFSIPIIFYKIIVDWIMGIEIPPKTRIGPGLVVHHGHSLVINDNSIIGNNLTVRHGVTIGCKINEDGSQGPSPKIGNYVDIGAGAIIIGDIQIGDRVKIGAGAVLTRSVPADVTVVGNPAVVVKKS